ncbi:MAG: Flp family type IVb pilin [Vicinamibacterales bacterium]
MLRLLTINRSLATEDDAQDLLEYAMLIGLIALVCIAVVTTVGMTVFTLFWDRIATNF